MSKAPPRKPLKWIASAKRDLDAMPDDVKDVFGYAIDLAQTGGKHVHAKPLSGFGSAGVLEVVDDFQGDTYRAVYTVRFSGWVYVLHCFQKKAKSGIRTPKMDIDLNQGPSEDGTVGIRGGQQEGPSRSEAMKQPKESIEEVIESSGNVYADLGYAEAGEMQRKAQLAAEIARVIKARRLTQDQAAELLGIDQSKVSRITRGQFRAVSEAKMLELVAKLGHDVKIVVSPVRRRAGKIELEFS